MDRREMPGEHEAVRALLPWLATDRLDATDQARVHAHLAHCAMCRADAEAERGLRDHVAAMPLSADIGWAAMRARIVANDSEPAQVVPLASARRWRGAGWLIAAQAAVLVAAVAIYNPRDRIAPYHALGAERTIPATGNILAAFRPDASAQAIADALTASGARIVDGPTAAGAFVLHVPDVARAEAIATLHQKPAVSMAESITL